MELTNLLHKSAPSGGSQTPFADPSGVDLLQQATVKVEQAFMQNSGNPYKQSLALQQIKNEYLAQRYNIQPNSVQL